MLQTVAVRAVERGAGAEPGEAGPEGGARTATRAVHDHTHLYRTRLQQDDADHTHLLADTLQVQIQYIED